MELGESEKKLLDAAERGDIDEVTRLIESGASVNVTDSVSHMCNEHTGDTGDCVMLQVC